MDFPSPAQMQATWLRRAAVKRFDPLRAIPASDWNFLMEVLELCPSAYGLQPYRIIDVRGKARRSLLQAASYGQPQVAEASRYLVLAVVTDFGEAELDAYLQRLREVRDLPDEAVGAYRQKVLERVLGVLTPVQRRCWQARQAYIALGALLWAAAQRGLDTCPLEAIDIAAYDRILGLPKLGLTAVLACAVGYRGEEESYADLPKVRLPREELVRVLED